MKGTHRTLQLVIPTYKRKNSQKTYESLPCKYKRQVQFVVREEEYDFFVQHYPDNVTHKLPKDVTNIAQTRQWITLFYNKDKVFVMDDNLTSFSSIRRNRFKENTFVRAKLTEKEFDQLFERITRLLDTYVHGGIILDKISPPKGTSQVINSRIMTNIFADFSKWPSDVRYDDPKDFFFATSDFYVNLALLTRGFPNVVITDVGVTKKMRDAGGCNSARTPENHNKSMVALNKMFPAFTKLKEKNMSSGPWKGKMVLGITCYWKKAFNKELSL